MGQFGNTATAMVLSHVIFWSAWPIILKGEDQDPCQQECIYCCGIPWNILITLFIDKQMNNTMPYFRDFSQYSVNSSGFSCQSVGSSRVLNCLFGSLIEMSGIWAADSHSFSATQKSHMLLAILLQEFIPPKLLMLAIITLVLSYVPYFL